MIEIKPLTNCINCSGYMAHILKHTCTCDVKVDVCTTCQNAPLVCISCGITEDEFKDIVYKEGVRCLK